MQLTNGVGSDTIFEASGSEQAVNQAIKIVRRGGSITLIGLVPEPTQLNLQQVILKQVSLIGVRAYTWSNCNLTMKLLADGKINLKPMITHTFSLEEWEKAFDILLKGRGTKIILKP